MPLKLYNISNENYVMNVKIFSLIVERKFAFLKANYTNLYQRIKFIRSKEIIMKTRAVQTEGRKDLIELESRPESSCITIEIKLDYTLNL